eukprot:1245671-Rhodomonas_salina.4
MERTRARQQASPLEGASTTVGNRQPITRGRPSQTEWKRRRRRETSGISGSRDVVRGVSDSEMRPWVLKSGLGF